MVITTNSGQRSDVVGGFFLGGRGSSDEGVTGINRFPLMMYELVLAN